MAIPRTASGKMDKRSKEYKAFKEKVSKSTKESAKPTVKKSTGAKRTADGTLDKRTKEGKAAAERMAKARAAKGGFMSKLKNLFS